MEMRSTRRIVTGHNSRGKAVVLFDDVATAKQRGGNGVTLFWVTSEFPVDAAGAADHAQTPVGVPPPRNGTVFRVVDFAPASPHGAPVDHIEILRAMGIDPATQGYARHANTHRTRTIDYAIVLDGEIDMLLDDSEIHVKAGDVLVQQATNHAWVNNGTRALPHRLYPDRRQNPGCVGEELEAVRFAVIAIGVSIRKFKAVKSSGSARPDAPCRSIPCPVLPCPALRLARLRPH